MVKVLEQQSPNVPNYSAVTFAWSDISSVIFTYLMAFGEGALLQRPLTAIAPTLCHWPGGTEK